MDSEDHSFSTAGASKGEVPANYLSWVDEAGHSIAECREISGIPGTAVAFDGEASGRAIAYAKQMMGDLFRGSVGTPPGGTLEVVFKPEIKKGLDEGIYTLLKAKNGDTFATAVSGKNKFVGNGRVVQTGQMRRLAVGSYQLISIAVAQSHLAEINDSLERIEGILGEIQNEINDASIGEIQGDISFLRNEAKIMSAMEHKGNFSIEKTHAIQNISRSFYMYIEKNIQNFKTLMNDIALYKNKEFLGTGDSFRDVKRLIIKVDNIIRKNNLILNLMLIHTIICSWIDPDEVKISRIFYDGSSWDIQMNKFKEACLKKSDELFASAITNSNETLELRREYLNLLVERYVQLALDQKSNYIESVNNLKKQVGRISRDEAETRFAVSFDTKGDVRAVAVM